MIHFEILKSPDSSMITKIEFFQNVIYIGKTKGNIILNDTSLLESHVMIEVINNDLIIHPQKNVDYYLIDGKRATSIRKIKTNQVITIGQTSFKIINFEETKLKSKKNTLDEKLNILIESNSSRLEIIEDLAKMMK
jgi:hypothetical protein